MLLSDASQPLGGHHSVEPAPSCYVTVNCVHLLVERGVALSLDVALQSLPFAGVSAHTTRF